jgi:hypothetical protein
MTCGSRSDSAEANTSSPRHGATSAPGALHSYRDRKDFAMEAAARLIKSKNLHNIVEATTARWRRSRWLLG